MQNKEKEENITHIFLKLNKQQYALTHTKDETYAAAINLYQARIKQEDEFY